MMRARARCIVPAVVVVGLLLTSGSVFTRAGTEDAAAVRDRVRAYVNSNRARVVSALAQLVALPNVASDLEAMERNARQLTSMMEDRGLKTRLLRAAGAPPAVYGERRAGGARRTVVFYAHYDGQAVVPERWASDPFTAVLRDGRVEDGGQEVGLDGLDDPAGGERRLYGRSTSDDKGSIIALLTALDALDAAGIPLSVNLKLFLDGEEERGSSHLRQILVANRELLDADLWVFCDGPVHQTRRPQAVFGVRGVTSVEIMAFGPAVALHSGHYGNWAPDPGMLLVQLVSSMRDPDGNITIDGIDELVQPLGEAARAAVDAAPPVEAELRHDLALGWTEGQPATLTERIMRPAINLLGISAGQVGSKAKNAIPPAATAVVGIRLVPDLTPEAIREATEAHIAQRGFQIVHEPPSEDVRRADARLVYLRWRGGYPALWTSMDLPVSRAVVQVLDQATDSGLVTTQSMGGSLPLYVFDEVLGAPVVVVPMANHDNNQHAANENLRLQNLWDGIEIYAALMARLGEVWE